MAKSCIPDGPYLYSIGFILQHAILCRAITKRDKEGRARERRERWKAREEACLGGSEGFVAMRWSISSTSANLRKKRTTYYVEE
jgi:hypothetical protein